MYCYGLGLVVISYDSPEILAAFSRQRGITFPLLSDAGSPPSRPSASSIRPPAGPSVPTRTIRPSSARFRSTSRPRPRRGHAAGHGVSGHLHARPSGPRHVSILRGLLCRSQHHVERDDAARRRDRPGRRDQGLDRPPRYHDLCERRRHRPWQPILTRRRRLAASRIHVYAPGASSYRPIALTSARSPLCSCRRCSIHPPRSTSSSRSTNGCRCTRNRSGWCRRCCSKARRRRKRRCRARNR